MGINRHDKEITLEENSMDKIRVLIVEDESITANILKKMLKDQGYDVVAIESSGEGALDSITKNKPNLILMDIQLEGYLDGIETAQIIKEKFDLPLIYITACDDTEILDRVVATEPFGYVSKPVNPRELFMAMEIGLYKYSMEKKLKEEDERAKNVLERAFFDLVNTVCRAVEFRDAYTAGHQERVGKLAVMVGNKMGLKQDDLNELYIGGLLHDVGKIGIPMRILNKIPPLTNVEYGIIKDHPRIGFNILGDAKLPWNIRDIVLNHHERLDGSGYPKGLTGNNLSRNVRIITACDVVEAMSTLRPYRRAKTEEQVVDELKKGKGIRYDRDVVDIILHLIHAKTFYPWA